MAIKLLSSDAEMHLSNQLRIIDDLISKWEAMALTLAARDRLPEIRANLSDLQKAASVYRRLLRHETAWAESEESPIHYDMSPSSLQNMFGRRVEGTAFLFQNKFYAVEGPYSVDEARSLLVARVRKQRREIDLLTSTNDSAEEFARVSIPEAVRHEVWRRDQSRCTRCGSNRNLEFDHVIPVSRGGSNTARNIQLLCEECNRRKSDSI